MPEKKKIVCIIPARLTSTRFPKKILSSLHNKPLLQWIWDAANKTKFFDEIIFAIDSQEAEGLIKSFGGKYLMTSQKCKTGTDRIIEIMHSSKVEADIWVNWQADEPFITPTIIKTLLQTCYSDKADVWTLKKLIAHKEDIVSPNVAKVVCDVDNFALYFSRAPIPCYRDKVEGSNPYIPKQIYYKHIGIFAYTTKALQKIAQLGHSYLEDAEKLEQLRFLHHKLSIKVNETTEEVVGIDTPEDLKKAEEFAKKLSEK